MKKIRSFFILILAAAFLASCSGLNKMKKEAGDIKYEVVPKVLEAHGGQVNVTIKGTFPEKYFNKKATLEVTPVLTYEGGETAFDKVQVLQGEKVQANNKVISYTGGDFTYTSTIPYKDAMKMSELVLRTTASINANSLDFDPIKLADGVIATSTLLEVHGRMIIMPDRYERIVPESQVADINYVINQANIRNSELKAEDIALLKQYIATADADPNKELKGAVVSSYASPDGKFEENEKLSGRRGTAADKFIKKEFDKIEAAKIDGFFSSLTTAEDWDGFKTEVQNSNIQDKELILRVLSMYSDPEQREKEIKNMSSAYEELKTDVLPKLRRSKMTVNVDNIGRTDEQILAQAKSDPKVLSLEEILHAGEIATDLNDKLAFYKAAADNFPKCVRAHNNVGCVLMNQGKADEALAAFDKAKAIANNDVVKNNTAFAHLVKGEIVKAEELFNSMTAATEESKWGLGMIAITRGEYDKAVNFFGNANCFNNALAQLLKGDVTRAKATLDAMTEPCRGGKSHYLKAVVGARLDDKNYMLAGLKEAIAVKPEWKAYAKTDLEFAKYFADSAFQGLVQ
ncbi:MAG TPA: tetratricopeptide repeat protein [Bacteroidales bacterium]|jgi:tetratricopeptide (TPR) repeat protein|nr:tetratricopeptide repeat protein [Bacteroidales bacterium]